MSYFDSVTFLGTSSGCPTNYRNVSSSCLKLSTGGLWMFDCGEGTQHQMLRTRHQNPPVPLSAQSVERLFITHMHGDHTYGIPGFLCSIGLHAQKAPASAQVAAAGVAPAENGPDHDENEGGHAVQDFSPTQKYMEIVGPQHLATFLRTALICSDSHFPWMYHVTELLPAGSAAPVTGTLHDNEAPPSYILPAEDGTYTVLSGHPSGVTVRAATLTHRVFCLGYALTEPSRPGKLNMEACAKLGVPKGPLFGQLQAGRSVTLPNGSVVQPSDVVSPPRPGRTLLHLGDTCDSRNAMLIAQGADWLIHEATFDDANQAQALPKGHSTARQAGAFAAQLQAKSLLLTHFSARYMPRSKDAGADMNRMEHEARLGFIEAGGQGSDLDVTAVEDFQQISMSKLKA